MLTTPSFSFSLTLFALYSWIHPHHFGSTVTVFPLSLPLSHPTFPSIEVSLTKTDKKGRENKSHLISEIQDSFGSYTHVYLFSVENMRNSHLKEARSEWPTSRFFFGKNKVMAKALGTTAEEEHRQNLHLLAEVKW